MGIRVESLSAQNVVERTVSCDAATKQDPQLIRSLTRLRAVVGQAQKDELEITGGQAIESPSSSLSWTEISKIVAEAGGIFTSPWHLSASYSTTNHTQTDIRFASFNLLSKALFENFTKAAHNMFQLNQKLTVVEEVLVYANLSNLCSSFSSMEEEPQAARFYDLAQQFGRLLLNSLTTFPMFAPPTMETAEALLCAVRFLRLAYGPRTAC